MTGVPPLLQTTHDGRTYSARVIRDDSFLANLYDATGGVHAVGLWSEVFDRLDGRTLYVRRLVPDHGGFLLELADADGKVMPDLRHPCQVEVRHGG